ncbi:MAG: insulinase family protein [Chlorobi bacterium]|nr:insulinase family protein [Chlorobiota bacterium]
MIKFDKTTLANGLKVIVHQDKSTPIVAMNIIYKVGSRDETPEKTGFAHLFEHLMFGGSVNIPKYDTPLQNAGGENNAFTNNDFTDYYLTLPKSNLETAFWLESDRMLSLAFSEKSLKVQRQVVVEEFKQNYLNQPYGDVYLLLKPLAFKKHPYRWNTIGKEISHIENATMEEVKDFYSRYYNPDNAILSIAGNVDADDIYKLSEKWFGGIKSGGNHKNIYDKEPVQLEDRELTVERRVPQNAVYFAWLMDERNSPGFYITDLISDILSNGNSSRLFDRLVKERKMFSELNAFVSGDIDNGLFIISGKLINGFTADEAEAAIDEQLDELKTKLVNDEELEKVKNKIEANLVFSSLSVLNKAMNLAYYELLEDALLLNKEKENYAAVSKSDIREKAKALFAQGKKNKLVYLAKN